MRVIKLALISAVILSIVLLLFSWMIPSHIRISRATNISVSKDSLLPALTDLRRWQQWNILVNNESHTDKQFTDSSFSSTQVKVMRNRLVGDTLFCTWIQPGGRQVKGTFAWQGSGDQLVLQWYFDIQLRWYPWEKFSSLIFDKQLGPPMEQSLDKLKKLLENKG